jgi:4-hydroxy-3-methylbut-2-enyl diphosphate reductase
MIVIRAAILGRCMGVRRAVDLAISTADKEGSSPVYTFGPLIHNPQAVAELAERGIVPLGGTELDGRLRGKVVVIRAHGVPPGTRSRLEELGARIVDATCPRVIASQRKAKAYAARGFTVIIAGDKDHGEVAGIEGYARGEAAGGIDNCRVVGTPEEAAQVESGAPVVLIAQTTIMEEEYAAIRDVLVHRFPKLEVVDSICPATEERRSALTELAARTDAILVVGGRNSANTSRLQSTALGLGKPAWHIETAAELPREIFGYARVGLTAGASTPESLIAEVEQALLSGSSCRGVGEPR